MKHEEIMDDWYILREHNNTAERHERSDRIAEINSPGTTALTEVPEQDCPKCGEPTTELWYGKFCTKCKIQDMEDDHQAWLIEREDLRKRGLLMFNGQQWVPDKAKIWIREGSTHGTPKRARDEEL